MMKRIMDVTGDVLVVRDRADKEHLELEALTQDGYGAGYALLDAKGVRKLRKELDKYLANQEEDEPVDSAADVYYASLKDSFDDMVSVEAVPFSDKIYLYVEDSKSGGGNQHSTAGLTRAGSKELRKHLKAAEAASKRTDLGL